jgi:cytoskeleton protein RodZ
MGAGEQWKAKRERLGKTLEEASQELRISRKYLQGIEEEEFAKWPPKVFSAGFIRAYAGLLDEDPEPVLSEYYAYIGALSLEERPRLETPQWIEREHRRGSRRAAYSLAALGVLSVGILLAWYSIHTAPRPPAEIVSPPKVEEEIPAAVPRPDNVVPAPPPAAVNLPERGPAPPKEAPVHEGVAERPPYQLLLSASELSWVMYSTDGAGPLDVMLYPGERISLQAQRSIYLKIGNAGGVQGTLNGKALPSFGEPGQVKEVHLGE